ncbi:MAG: hypothetical protein ACKOJF_21315 [Planctomycetaceae bacterium]
MRLDPLMQWFDILDPVQQKHIQIDQAFLKCVRLPMDSKCFPNGPRYLRLLAIEDSRKDGSQSQQDGAEDCDQQECPGPKQQRHCTPWG